MSFFDWLDTFLARLAGMPHPGDTCAKCGVAFRDHELSTCKGFVPRSMKVHP